MPKAKSAVKLQRALHFQEKHSHVTLDKIAEKFHISISTLSRLSDNHFIQIPYRLINWIGSFRAHMKCKQGKSLAPNKGGRPKFYSSTTIAAAQATIRQNDMAGSSSDSYNAIIKVVNAQSMKEFADSGQNTHVAAPKPSRSTIARVVHLVSPEVSRSRSVKNFTRVRSLLEIQNPITVASLMHCMADIPPQLMFSSDNVGVLIGDSFNKGKIDYGHHYPPTSNGKRSGYGKVLNSCRN
jgi:AraC-like DNA-binding protein